MKLVASGPEAPFFGRLTAGLKPRPSVRFIYKMGSRPVVLFGCSNDRLWRFRGYWSGALQFREQYAYEYESSA